MLSIFRMSLAPCGRIIAVTFTLPVVKLLGDDKAAWFKAMAIWATIAFILLVICFMNCKEVVRDEAAAEGAKTDVPLGRNVSALLTNQYFWATLILWTVTCVHGTIVGTSLPYYCKYIFKNDGLYSYLYLAEAGTLILGAMLCPMLLRRFGKRDLSLAGAIMAVVGQALFLLNPGSFAWALITSIIRALGEAPLTGIVFGMMGDVVDFGLWKTGIRQESLIFGGGSLGFKIGTGITSAVITRMLSAAGYISSVSGSAQQPDSAISMIRSIYIWGPIIVWVVAVIVLILYRLDKLYPQIMKDLMAREGADNMKRNQDAIEDVEEAFRSRSTED